MITGNRYYNNPQIGQALNNIAQAFLGSPAEDADIARTRLLNAQTGAVTQGTAGLDQLSQLFGQGAGVDPAAVYGAAARGGVLNQIPDALLGFNAATNPDISGDAISNLMLGAGLSASSTPVGLNATLANNLDQEGMRQAGALERHLLGLTNNLDQEGMRQAGALERQQLADLVLSQDQTAVIADPARAGILGGNQFDGLRSPLSLTEAQGGAFSSLPLDDQQDVLLSDINVEEIMGPDGPLIVSRGDAIGQAPFQSGGTAQTPRNYVVIGADGQPIAQSSGYMTPEGRLIDIGTQEPVLVPEGAQVRMQSVDGEGGMMFEADGQGGFRLVTGGGELTVASQSRQQENLIGADRALGILTQLYGQMDRDDVGVRGNVNEYMTRTLGQILPELGRPDVVGDRALMVAAREQAIQSVTADPRLSDQDFNRLQRTMPQTGLFESFEGAQASLAEMIALMVYNREHARFALGGQQLPEFGPEQARQLVDSGLLPLEVASTVASARNWTLPGSEAAAPTVYEPGYEEGGYRFTGGDPTAQANWERIQ